MEYFLFEICQKTNDVQKINHVERQKVDFPELEIFLVKSTTAYTSPFTHM